MSTVLIIGLNNCGKKTYIKNLKNVSSLTDVTYETSLSFNDVTSNVWVNGCLIPRKFVLMFDCTKYRKDVQYNLSCLRNDIRLIKEYYTNPEIVIVCNKIDLCQELCVLNSIREYAIRKNIPFYKIPQESNVNLELPIIKLFA